MGTADVPASLIRLLVLVANPETGNRRRTEAKDATIRGCVQSPLCIWDQVKVESVVLVQSEQIGSDRVQVIRGIRAAQVKMPTAAHA